MGNPTGTNSKLTILQMRQIRTDPRTQQAIADEYGVARSRVSQIKSGHDDRRQKKRAEVREAKMRPQRHYEPKWSV